jgi:cyclopropane-fatty-acyl-phospholipid synthase
LLGLAGVAVNGDRPWDIRVHDERMYGRVLKEGTLGLGESYMDGWWDAPALDQFIARVSATNLQSRLKGDWKLAMHVLRSKLLNFQTRSRAFEWASGTTTWAGTSVRLLDGRILLHVRVLEDRADARQAQEAKLDLVCRKIGLREA